MNYVLMGITCVVFVYIVYRMGKSHTKECNDDITNLQVVENSPLLLGISK